MDEVKTSNSNKLSRKKMYILYFLLFSFVGWCIESLYSIYELGYFTKRGFLYGPICPIYGYGALILIIFLSKHRNNSIKLFLYSAIIFSAFEYIVGYGLDALFALKWWDYTNEFFNLNGRISIFYSVAWGIFAILFVNNAYPFLKKKINILLSKIPYKLQVCSLYILLSIFVLDTVLSCVRYF